MADTRDVAEASQDDALLAGLRALGYESFRPGQREAIETVLEGGRLLLVAPTGGGKSLTYQLPATLLPGTTLVISPLIALMNDQVMALTERGIPATYLASTLDADEARVRMAAIAAGEFKLVYAAPERLAFAGFRRLIAELDCPLVAVDEAHCISEWGHDFRPEYLQLGGLLADLAPRRILACTATATPVVRDEILARLDLPSDTPQLLRGFARPNLILRSVEVEGPTQARHEVDGLLQEAIGGAGAGRGAAIIYAGTRRATEREAERLAGLGFRVDHYHAGRDARDRQRVQAAFACGELEVVVATNAFGMGIDRADVRAVIHLSPPGSIESYYQEVGRAGRDGEPAHGLLLSSHADYAKRRRLIEAPVDGRRPRPEVVEHKWNLFLELMRWVEGGGCRHDAILRYFGDEAEAMGGCGRCDTCQQLSEQPAIDSEAADLIVRKVLSGVARVHGSYGLTRATHLLTGRADDRLRRDGLDQVSTFGILSQHDPAWVNRLIRRCVTAGWVAFSGDERPVVMLTAEGAEVMRGERGARLLLPSLQTRRGGSAPGVARPRRAAPTEGLDSTAAALFESLRAHRLALAREEGVPPYVIASDRSLRDLAVLRPQRLSDLLMVHGIGPAKVERYGEGLLEVVAGAAPTP